MSGLVRALAKCALTAVVSVTAWRLGWGAQAGVLLGVLAASLTGLLDGRLSVVMGLVLIAACPILLIGDQNAWLQQSSLINYYAANAGVYTLRGAADQVAVWAYYFLAIGVSARAVRYLTEKKRRPRVAMDDTSRDEVR